MAQKLIKLGNKNIVILPQHIDWNRFDIPRSKDALKELNIPDRYVVGFVGRLSQEKNISTILQCATMLPEISFVIVGDGQQKQQLMQIASKLNNVFFVGQRNDIERFYSAFDILIISSIMEGIPLVILESMMSGTPAIASNVGAISEVISESTGILVNNPSDAGAFARAIVRMRNELGLWSKCSENGKTSTIEMREKCKNTNINHFYNMLFKRG
jgi:glycosyltransferase involved in cell wall biosynthesis